jgi:putative redox protein
MSIRASAHRVAGTLRHEVTVGRHVIVTDEPFELGGFDSAATPHELIPASLAACIATTVELYARRKNWDVGEVVVDVDYDAEREPRHVDVTVHLPDDLTSEQIERIARIAGKCPVRRALESDFSFDERVERTFRVVHRQAA